MDNKFLNIKTNKILILMYFTCFASVLWIAKFIEISIARIVSFHTSRDFITKIDILVKEPSLLCLKSCIYMLILGLSFLIRLKFGKDRKEVLLLSLLLDFIIALNLIILLGFNYNGILLWVFTNTLIYLLKNRFSPFIIALGILSYVLTDRSIISLWIKSYKISNFIGIYDRGKQAYLYLIYNMLNITTIVLFFIACLIIIIKKDETIKESKNLYEKLALANASLIKANKKLESMMKENEKLAEIRERNRIAREIHDTMGHTLTGIIAGIDACIALAENSSDILKNQLKLISDVSRKSVNDIRASVSSLRPDALERFNLNLAIKSLIENTKKVMGIEIDYYCNDDGLKFDEDEENAIYRIIQESITNAIRHGKATKIKIILEKKRNEIYISVSDNGIGCASFKEGFGTRHIKERIEMLSGKVNFKMDEGFEVSAVVPIRWGEDYD